jgi:Flp pilus assembly protein TadD
VPIRIAEERQEDGEHLEELIQRARQAFLAGNIKEAKRLFREASLIDANHPEVCHGFGVIALREGRYKEAITFLRRAVEKKSDFPEAWNNLGFAYFKKGKYIELKSLLSGQ